MIAARPLLLFRGVFETWPLYSRFLDCRVVAGVPTRRFCTRSRRRRGVHGGVADRRADATAAKAGARGLAPNGRVRNTERGHRIAASSVFLVILFLCPPCCCRRCNCAGVAPNRRERIIHFRRSCILTGATAILAILRRHHGPVLAVSHNHCCIQSIERSCFALSVSRLWRTSLPPQGDVLG